MKRSAPLKSKSRLKPTPLRKVSAKQAKCQREYRKVPLGKCLCGSEATDQHHIYAQGKNPRLKTDPLNIVPLCRQCHDRAQLHMKEFRSHMRTIDIERMLALDRLAGRPYDEDTLAFWEEVA